MWYGLSPITEVCKIQFVCDLLGVFSLYVEFLHKNNLIYFSVQCFCIFVLILLAIVLSVLQFMAFDNLLCIFKLFFFLHKMIRAFFKHKTFPPFSFDLLTLDLQLLITPLISSNFSSFLLSFTFKHKTFIYVPSLCGPGWLNELISWITQQLIQAYHQYGMGLCPAL